MQIEKAMNMTVEIVKAALSNSGPVSAQHVANLIETVYVTILNLEETGRNKKPS